TVKRFAEEGAFVVCAGIDEAEGFRTVEEVASDRVIFLKLDGGDEASWKSVIAETLARFGALQILDNNATHRSTVTSEQTTLQIGRSNQRVTSEGVFLGTKLAGEVITGKGSIVNLPSIGAFVGMPPSFPYSAAKGAVRALSRPADLHFAQEWR